MKTRKKILIGVLVAVVFIVAVLYIYETYLSPGAAVKAVEDLNRWEDCRVAFIKMYREAGGNPYTTDGQSATDKYCGTKP